MRDRNLLLRRATLITSFTVTVILCVPNSVSAEAPNILFYGNSFTQYNSLPTIVRNIAVAAGKPAPTVVNAAVAGQTLGYHLASNTAVISNQGVTWDFVVLQEYSTKPTHIGNPTGFRNDAVALFNVVKNHSNDVTPVLFQTWARGPASNLYPGSFSGPLQMQSELRSNYDLAKGSLDAINGTSTRLAKVGDVWEYGSFSADLYDNGDQYHPSKRGSLIAALTVYQAIYLDDVSDINLTSVASPLGISGAVATQLAGQVDAVMIVPEPTSMVSCALVGAVGILARRRQRTTVG